MTVSAIPPSPQLPQGYAPQSPKTLPPLDPPLSITESEQFLDRLFSSATNPCHTNLLVYLLVMTTQQYQQFLTTKQQHLRNEKGFLAHKEEVKSQQLEQQEREVARIGMVNRVSQSISSLGLMGSGIASWMAGNPAGLPATALGALMALDQLLDDAGKRLLSSWLTGLTAEPQATWRGRITTFCDVASFALSFGLQQATALRIATKASDSALTALKGTLEYQYNVGHAFFVEIQEECRTSSKNVERLINDMQKIIETITYLYENCSRYLRQRKGAVSHILRN